MATRTSSRSTSDDSGARSTNHSAGTRSRLCVAPGTGWSTMSDELNTTRWRPRLGTVRARVTLLATAAVAAVLVITSFGLVSVQRSTLTRGIDEALRQTGDDIAPGLTTGRV